MLLLTFKHIKKYFSRVSSITVRAGCTLTLYRNGNLGDQIYEIQAPLTESISQRNLGAASDQTR